MTLGSTLAFANGCTGTGVSAAGPISGTINFAPNQSVTLNATSAYNLISNDVSPEDIATIHCVRVFAQDDVAGIYGVAGSDNNQNTDLPGLNISCNSINGTCTGTSVMDVLSDNPAG